jgi:hypothetical protein
MRPVRTLINICDQLHRGPTCARSVNSRPGDDKKGAARLLPPRPNSYLAGPGAETPVAVLFKKSSAGDPSEVTALGIKHWITSFRC